MENTDEFEVISGHRRLYAAQKAGITELPAFVHNISRDEAVVEMVDSNIQRENILPSEKAKAYKMKMDALNRQGNRTDLTSCKVGTKFRTDELIAENSGESARTIQRYIRLINLIPPLLKLVDDGIVKQSIAHELMRMALPTARALRCHTILSALCLKTEDISASLNSETSLTMMQFHL